MHLIVVDFDQTKTVTSVPIDHDAQIRSSHALLIPEKKRKARLTTGLEAHSFHFDVEYL